MAPMKDRESTDWLQKITMLVFECPREDMAAIDAVVSPILMNDSRFQFSAQHYIGEVVRIISMGGRPNVKFVNLLRILVDQKCVGWDATRYLQTVLSTLEIHPLKPLCLVSFIEIIDFLYDKIKKLRPAKENVLKIVDVYVRLFQFYVDAAEAMELERREIDCRRAQLVLVESMTDALGDTAFQHAILILSKKYHDEVRSYSSRLSKVLNVWAAQRETAPLQRQLLSLAVRLDSNEIRDLIPRRHYFSFMDSLEITFDPIKNRTPVDLAMDELVKNRPGILSLVTIYANRLVYATPEEIARTVTMFGHVTGMRLHDVIRDLIRGSLLTLEEMLASHDEKLTTSLDTATGHSFNFSSRKSDPWHFPPAAYVFFIRRLPKVLGMLMVQWNKGCYAKGLKENNEKDILIAAITRLVKRSRTLWDVVDEYSGGNELESFCSELVKLGLILDTDRLNLAQIRMRDVMDPSIPNPWQQMLENSKSVEGVYGLFRQGNLASMMSALSTLTRINVFLVDMIVVWPGISSCRLGECSSRLAQANLDSGSVGRVEPMMRERLFDTSFLVLYRILDIDYMSLDDIVTDCGKDIDNKRSPFYQWSLKYAKHVVARSAAETTDDSETAMEVDVPERIMSDTERKVLERLKQGHLPWEPNSSVDFGEFLDSLPQMFDSLLDDVRRKRIETSRCIELIVSATVERAAFFVICMVQWLQCQKYSEARRLMSECILQSLNRLIVDVGQRAENSDRKKLISFVRSCVLGALNELVQVWCMEPGIVMYHKTVAQLSFPRIQKHQLLSPSGLKETFIYMQCLNWVDGKVMALVHNCNTKADHRSWIRILLAAVLKAHVVDDMGRVLECLSACLLLDPLRSTLIALEGRGPLIEPALSYLCSEYKVVIQVLMDVVRNDAGADPLTEAVRYEYPQATAFCRLVANVMMIAVSLIDWHGRLKIEGEVPRVAAQDDPVGLLLATLAVSFDKIDRDLQSLTLNEQTPFLMDLLRSVACTRDCKAKRLLCKLFLRPRVLMLKAVGATVPSQMPIGLFRVFVSGDSDDDILEAVHHLLVQRAAGMVPRMRRQHLRDHDDLAELRAFKTAPRRI